MNFENLISNFENLISNFHLRDHINHHEKRHSRCSTTSTSTCSPQVHSPPLHLPQHTIQHKYLQESPITMTMTIKTEQDYHPNGRIHPDIRQYLEQHSGWPGSQDSRGLTVM